MDSTDEHQTVIPVKKIIVVAFLTPWLMRDELLKKLALPISLLITLGYFERYMDHEFDETYFIYLFITTLIYAYLAVTCHRIVILGGSSVPPFGIRQWTMRETRFFGWLVGITVVLIFVAFSIMQLSAPLLVPFIMLSDDRLPFGLLLYIIILLPFIYMLARVSIIFPATAIDERPRIGWAWKLTKQNGWRLVLIVGILPFVTGYLLSSIERSDSTVLEYIFVSLITYVAIIVEISALSLAYKELRARNLAISVD